MNLAIDYFYKNIPNTDINQRFKINFKSVTRPLLSWKEELIISAKQIVESTNKTIYVLMSGGIDSELVARVLIEIGVDFKALTLKHKSGTNQHETKYADSFCVENNIKQEVVYLDVPHFISKGIDKYIHQGYRATKIYYYQQLFLLEKLEELDGFGIGGAYEQIYHTLDISNKNEVCLGFNPSYMMAMDWIKNHNTDHQLWFYLSTPEIHASYMKHELIEFLLQRPEYFIDQHWINREKTLIYHKEWPKIKRRNKASGFERISMNNSPDILGNKQSELRSIFPDLVDMYIPVSTIKQQLRI
jgi:hypothetical protein